MEPIYIMLIAIFVVIMIGGALWDSTPSFKSFCDYPDEISTAAFRWIGMPSITPSYLGGKVDQLDTLKRHIAKRREESKLVVNDELRNCILAWLHYYEGQYYRKHERELVNQTSRVELDEYKAKQKIERAKVDRILAAEKR